MQRLTINVPDSKVHFFKELIQSLGFTQANTDDIVLTSKQESLVRHELKKAKENPDSLLDWEEEQHQIDWNAC